MSAVRFAMFAERATVVLAEAKAIQATPFDRGMAPDARGMLAKAKLAAADHIAAFKAALYPPDVN